MHPGFFSPKELGEELDVFITPHQQAPVIVRDDLGLTLRFMKFSLVPAWSNTSKVAFATHNARLDGLAEKATWRKPLVTRRAVVPLSSFVEPIYVREHAGHMVEFFRKDLRTLYAAALWDEWTDKTTGEVLESFAIITDEPYLFVEETGHERSPLFLNDDAIEGWLDPAKRDPRALLQYLREHRIVPEFDCRRFRALKPGWEKRRNSR